MEAASTFATDALATDSKSFLDREIRQHVSSFGKPISQDFSWKDIPPGMSLCYLRHFDGNMTSLVSIYSEEIFDSMRIDGRQFYLMPRERMNFGTNIPPRSKPRQRAVKKHGSYRVYWHS
jgi:hypothetical protein